MENIEKTETLNKLFSYYGALLTDKQQAYYTNYYHLDLSLQEIAELFNVSRNAVHQQLQNVEKHLLNFEEKLKLVQTGQKRSELLDKLETTKDFKYIKDLRKLDE
ncbi:MAG TPA: HTH domain-containing protein [Acholeplasmataceae bacterium]|nr:HTH domain-containing protein [Acholeplasmataceae bacterium]